MQGVSRIELLAVSAVAEGPEPQNSTMMVAVITAKSTSFLDHRDYGASDGEMSHILRSSQSTGGKTCLVFIADREWKWLAMCRL